MLVSHKADAARQFEDLLFEEMSGAGTEPLPSDRVVWLCMHCQDLPTERSPMALRDLEGHLERTYVFRFILSSTRLIIVVYVRHDVSQPQLDQDYAKDFAAPQIYQTGTRFQMSIVDLLE
jgi:hypothetical protein